MWLAKFFFGTNKFEISKAWSGVGFYLLGTGVHRFTYQFSWNFLTNLIKHYCRPTSLLQLALRRNGVTFAATLLAGLLLYPISTIRKWKSLNPKVGFLFYENGKVCQNPPPLYGGYGYHLMVTGGYTFLYLASSEALLMYINNSKN